MNLESTAIEYAAIGYPVLPIAPGDKRPLTSHGLKDATTDVGQIERWLTQWPTMNVAIATDGTLTVDVDGADNAWPHDEAKRRDLFATSTARTPRGGYHHIFQADRERRNTSGKLASGVDTRANGGYVLVAPSIVNGKSYEWINELVPRDQLLLPPSWLVTSLDEQERPIDRPSPLVANDGGDVEARAIAYLRAMPEAIQGQNGSGKCYAAAAAMVHGFALPVETAYGILETHYNPRCVPSWSEKELRHKVTQAADKPHEQPRGYLLNRNERPNLPAVDFSQFETSPQTSLILPDTESAELKRHAQDRGLMPLEWMRVPGFISNVMDDCLESAPYPNQPLAFCGALALQAFLAGRKIRDSSDNRTNIYILALAGSAVGKDWPRKLNTKILHQVGLIGSLGDRFASGEGLQDALHRSPSMLFQSDEIDSLLQSINKSKDARHEAIISTMLQMYSSSNSVFKMRSKSGQREGGETIDQPCLVIFGTATPQHCYEALSERMLSNGFFARMVIVEGGSRGVGQEAKIIEPSPRVIETAAYWADYFPGKGNMREWVPSPLTVFPEYQAAQRMNELREAFDGEYTNAEHFGDAAAMAVWGRTNETMRKLALLYAISANHLEPVITSNAVNWAGDIAFHQARRMLFMAAGHVAANPFDAECLRMMRKLRDAPSGQLTHSLLLKRMKLTAQHFATVAQTLVARGDIETTQTPTRGIAYRLVL